MDDCPYSTILARQDDVYYKGFADWCATRDGTLPRRDGSTSEERSLASWFRHKLRLYYSDDLSDEELVKLKKIPAIDEHFCLHGQWSLKFALKSMSFEDWCAKHRRVLPPQGDGTAEQRSLADWPENTISSYQNGHNGKHPENKLPYLRKIPVPFDFEISSKKSRSRCQCEYFALKCKSFEDWCAQHGGSLPKQRGDTHEERSLANWLMHKLRRYRRGKLSDEQLAQLRKIPAMSEVFSVQGKSFRSEHFALKCKNFEDWCAQHGGSLPKQRGDTQEERSLADWLKYELRRYRCGNLSDDQLARLRKIPAISEVLGAQVKSFRSSEYFVLKCKSFEAWCAQHGDSLPKRSGDTQEERSLATWLTKRLFRYRRGKLADAQRSQLRKIPAISEVFSDQGKSFRSEHFARKCKSFEDWCAQHGGSLPKRSGDTQEERSLAIWLVNKLFRYKRGKLSVDQLAQLRKIPAICDLFSTKDRPPSLSERFELKCKSLENWCTSQGTLPKQKGDTQEERSLAIWLRDKLFSYRRCKLSDDQLAQLRKISAISELFSVQGKSFRSEPFALKCKRFENWCAQHGGSLPKERGDTQEERSLAIWLRDKLFSYRRCKLSDDQLAQLRKISAISELFSDQGKSFRSEYFALKCKNFEDWCAQHGGSLPKQTGDTQEEKSLGTWFTNKVFRYRCGKLSADQLVQLRKIPAICDLFSTKDRSRSQSERFDIKCKSFENWCASQGTLPKQKGDTQEERSLAIWLRDKLFSYRRCKLSDDQLAQLRKISAISELFSVQGKSFRSEPFALKCKRFENWCAQHGGSLPKERGDTQEERSLAIWLKNKLFRHRRGKLSDDQLARLRAIPEVANMFESRGT